MFAILFYVAGVYKQTPSNPDYSVTVRLVRDNADRSPLSEFTLTVPAAEKDEWAARVGTFSQSLSPFN